MTGLLGMLFDNPLLFVVTAVALAFSVTIHEFSHAYVADKLGDSTAKNLGRVSLNPLAHLDPLGALTLLIAGFGWGKAVPINHYNLKNPRRDVAVISFAGPGSNFLTAIFLTLTIKIVYSVFGANTSHISLFPTSILVAFLYPVIFYNIALGIFNLLPIEPLDGFKIVNGLLPPQLSIQWVQLAPYGIFILIFMVITGSVSKIISPVVGFFVNLLQL